MAHLSISCLGPFQVALDGQPVTDFKSNKVRALLIYLAVEADRPHRREVLAGLLWPDWPDRDALGNLRYTLANLRRVIGDRARAGGRDTEPPFLLITRDTLQFNTASDYSLDVAIFTELVEVDRTHSSAIDQLEQAVALYGAGLSHSPRFLEGFSLGDSPAFEEWVLFTRERLAARMSSALHRLAAAYEGRGEYERAQSFARQQIEMEPWDETAHQQLMRAFALSGQRSAALAQYEACRRLLAEELGVEPAAETVELYEQIRDGALTAPVPVPARPPALAAQPPSFLEEAGPPEVERPLFVARERELAQLDRFLDLALAGQGRVAFVTGEAGSGKTALLQEFSLRAQAAHPDLVVAGGQGNAHTGVGDPYLPFREILGLLSGDVEAQWAAGAMTRELARRLWHLLPLAIEALVKTGPDLIDLMVPGAPLLERAQAVRPWPLEPVWLAQLETLVTRKATAPAIPDLQQHALFEQYTQVLRTLAGEKPLLLTMDDLQWADGGSLHLLFHLGRRLAGNRILIVGAYRPAEIALGRPTSPPVGEGATGELAKARERHPLESIVNEFKRTFGDIEVDLEQMEGRQFVDALLDSEPNRLGDAFREMLHGQTHGHPLFTIELLRGMQERGDLVRDDEGRWVKGPALDWETLPARVEAVIAERIGRLAGPLRAALRVASVEGEVFTAEVVARVSAVDEEKVLGRLSRELDRRHRLIRAQSIQRMDSQLLSRYRFRHILFQKYLYSSLDEVERVHLHEQVGNALERLYGALEETAATAAVAAIAPQLAWHFQEAGIEDKAVTYLHQAGKRAVQLSAYQEAIGHLTKGLELLAALPDRSDKEHRLERAEQELALQLALSTAWPGIKGTGSPEMEKTYTRARELCQQLGKTTQLCLVVGGLSILYYVRAEYHRARELAEEALRLAQQTGDPLLAALCHSYLGFTLFCLGEYAAARANFQEMIAFYKPQQHHRPLLLLRGSDHGVSALAYDACCLWCLGYPEEALKRSQEALVLARELSHPFSLADALCYGGCQLHAMRRDAQALKDYAEELKRLTGDKLPGWRAYATWHRGGAMAMLGQVEEGIAQIREGIATNRSVGLQCYLSGPICSLAEAQAMAGRPEEGLATLAEALAQVETTDERYCEAEIHRLKGELLLMQADEAEAEASFHQAERCFQRAIEVARRQQAKSWELRATVSLCRLWQKQGRTDEARHMLAEVYGWFTEGFDSPDLQEARALLDELA